MVSSAVLDILKNYIHKIHRKFGVRRDLTIVYMIGVMRDMPPLKN